MVEIEVKSGTLKEVSGKICIVPCLQGEKGQAIFSELAPALGSGLASVLSAEGFESKFLQTTLLRCDGKIGFERLLLAGLGAASELSLDRISRSIGKASALVRKLSFEEVSIYTDTALCEKAEDLAQAVIEGLILSGYVYGAKPKKDNKVSTITQCQLLTSNESAVPDLQKGAAVGQAIAEGVCYARELCTMPANVVTPSYLAQEAIQIATNEHMSVEIFDREKIHDLGMGAYEAVALGTDEAPKFIVMHYKGAKEKDTRPVALVGKSVTFDTGGISLKPSAKMEQMKYDMSGGATVLGVMKIVAALKPALNIVAVLPATDNMPSGKAVHPGDVVTALNGKTIEIINTDAEGRLCLADALTYATRFNPTAMIDLATLTGACVVALGQHAMGLMSNNDALAAELSAAGEAVSERTWALPLWDDYFNQIESDVADLQNVGGRGAGTITAGLFLKQFVGETPWVHLDIAGTSWFDDGRHPCVPKGATGIGVRLLTHYLRSVSEK